MLSWSAESTDRTIELRAIVDGATHPGVPGGRLLIELGIAAVDTAPDPGPVAAIAGVLGPEAALKAASVAGAFEIFNRVVDATGLPVGRAYRERSVEIIDALGLDAFPHANH